MEFAHGQLEPARVALAEALVALIDRVLQGNGAGHRIGGGSEGRSMGVANRFRDGATMLDGKGGDGLLQLGGGASGLLQRVTL